MVNVRDVELYCGLVTKRLSPTTAEYCYQCRSIIAMMMMMMMMSGGKCEVCMRVVYNTVYNIQ